MEAQDTPKTPANETNGQAAAQAQPGAESVQIHMPAAGKTETVPVIPGVVYHIDIDQVGAGARERDTGKRACRVIDGPSAGLLAGVASERSRFIRAGLDTPCTQTSETRERV